MKLTVEALEERYLRAVFEETDAAFLNALRRTLMTDLPCLAIEHVVVYENTGPLFDEVLAHRIGQLPIPLTRDNFGQFNFRATCSGCNGDGCPSCTVEFALQVTAEREPVWVLASDLRPIDKAYSVADPDIPIAYLDRGQSIMLTATAQLGTGRQHSRWAAVAAPAYREFPHVKVRGEVDLKPDERRTVQALAPKGAFQLKGSELAIKDEVATYDFIRNTEDMIEWKGVTVSEDPDRFLFEFETTGALPADLALERALAILLDHAKGARDQAPKLEPGPTVTA